MSTEQNIRRDNTYEYDIKSVKTNANSNSASTKNNTGFFKNLFQGGNMNPYLLGIGAVGGLMNYMNRPEDISFTGNMSNFQSSNYNASPDLLRSIRGVGQRAKTLSGYGDEFMDQYRSMIDPQSAYQQQLQGQLREQVGDATAQTVGNQSAMLAQRGIGGGGMSSLLSAAAGNRANEQIRQGALGIQQQSLSGAGQFGGMATSAGSAAGDLAARAAGFRGDIDARTLQNEQFNVQGQNQYQQYLDMARYNSQVQNQNANQSWMNNNMNFLGGLAGLMV